MAKLKENGVRKRRNNSKKKSKHAPENSIDSATTAPKNVSSPNKTESFMETMKHSPMFLITIVVLLPYGLYNAYLSLFLQHPEIISFTTMGIVQPRPAVHLTDPRQVLIIGTISSGTSQVADDLKKKLGLEIGHENAEASWSFVRDGTVSWFHGIRYIPRPGIDNDANNEFLNDGNILEGKPLFQSVVDHLCKELRPTMGFHPFMFRDGKCSLRQKWDDCWKDECKDILTNEWGCGLRKGDNGNISNSCETPFQNTLHQARHPLRTVESLVTKFCIGGVKGKVQPSFLAFAGDLFPQHNFLEMSCIEAAGYYTVEYNNAILAAREKGYVNDTFKVEQTTPCVMAQIAGFMDENARYSFHKSRLLNICNSKDSEATKLMKSKKNLVNKGQLSLDWDDLIGGKHGSRKLNGDRDLYKHLKSLEQALGYQ